MSDDVFHWPEYYMGSENPEENILDADSDMEEKFNGRLVRKANGEYGLKVNIYGYDDRMLNELNDYLLEGEIDPEKMREEDTVILATLMDGQGTMMESVCLPEMRFQSGYRRLPRQNY